MKTYHIGLVYWSHGSMEPFESVKVLAYTETEALNKAANILRPNSMQTLTIIKE